MPRPFFKNSICTSRNRKVGLSFNQLDRKSSSSPLPGQSQSGGDHQGLSLPTVSINGHSGQELATALGTVLQVSSGGVDYTVLGSVPPTAAEMAASVVLVPAEPVSTPAVASPIAAQSALTDAKFCCEVMSRTK